MSDLYLGRNNYSDNVDELNTVLMNERSLNMHSL